MCWVPISISGINSIKTFDFSTPYTTIPHSKLKECLKSIFFRSFFNKNGTWQYMYLFYLKCRHTTYFVKDLIDSNTKFTDTKCSDAWLTDWQYFCWMWRTYVSTDHWHSCGSKLCTIVYQFVSVLIWSRVHSKYIELWQ